MNSVIDVAKNQEFQEQIKSLARNFKERNRSKYEKIQETKEDY
ncbi:hypothetical protein [Acinetobacter schindleri]|nr:hypothetical protein [Acinetobacter schindleri]